MDLSDMRERREKRREEADIRCTTFARQSRVRKGDVLTFEDESKWIVVEVDRGVGILRRMDETADSPRRTTQLSAPEIAGLLYLVEVARGAGLLRDMHEFIASDIDDACVRVLEEQLIEAVDSGQQLDGCYNEWYQKWRQKMRQERGPG